ncbi:MAG: lipocalin-like domain-containing protein [Pseudomonadota bacterium]
MWRLVSWQVTDGAGRRTKPYGDHPVGQIIYTANGEMSAQLMAEVNPAASLDDGAKDKTVAQTVADQFIAYFGRYDYDETNATLSHHVEGSLLLNWVGTTVTRQVRHLDHQRLDLGAHIAPETVSHAQNLAGNHHLVWHRVLDTAKP